MSSRRVAHTGHRVVVPCLLGALALLLAGCAGGQEGGNPAAGFTDPGMGHVHGLGVDAATGDVLAATHTGLFRLVEGELPVRVADRWQDTMGFTVDGDRLLGSGHPDQREDLPVHLGLIESTDAGQTWTPVSLLGEADLHALTVAGDGVFAWDSVSGAVLASGDDGRTWQRGETFDAVGDLVARATAATGTGTGTPELLVTTADGLLISTDRGARFGPMEPQPPVLLSQIETLDGGSELVGVGVDGSVWRLAEDTWAEAGSLPGAPAAFTVTPDGSYLAATDQEVLRSDDDGRTWEQVAVLGTGAGR
jgi:hypothetical protein